MEDSHGGFAVTGADTVSDASAEGEGLPLRWGGGWREGMDTAREAGDRVIGFVSNLLARHGWTAVFLLVVWYNCKEPVKRRYRMWTNQRSLAEANRPDRRAVRDRERARSVAEKQAKALEDARALAEKKELKRLQSYENAAASIKED